MNKPNKKLMIITTVPNTITGILKGQPKYLSDTFDIVIATSPGDKIPELIEREGIVPHQVKMVRGISPFKDVVSIFKMIRLIRKLRPDIVHSFTPKAGLVGMISAKLTSIPIRIHTFTGLLFPTATGFKKRLLLWTDRLISGAATHVVPEGNGVRKDLESNYVTKKPLRLIGNGNIAGVDLNYFDPSLSELALRATSLRKEFSIPKDAFVFGFIGRFNRDKGLQELVEAFVDQSKDAWLLCLGVFDETAPLPADTYATMQKHPRIILAGYKIDIRPYLMAMNGLVQPSYREGFPNVVLQASAMRLPVIGTNINGTNEIIVPSETGILVPSHDANALGKAMKCLVEMKSSNRKQMGANGQKRIHELFEQESYREHLKCFYNSLL